MSMQKQLEANKSTQIKYIRQGFDKIIDALVKKKESLMDEVSEKYDNEISAASRGPTNSHGKMKSIDELKDDINSLKNIQTKGNKTKLTHKAIQMKDFHEKFSEVLNDIKMKASHSAKIGKVDHDAHKVNQGMKKEFIPVTIDSTSAISYILNIALNNASIAVNLKNIQDNSNPEKESRISSQTPSNKIRSNKILANPVNVKKKSSDTK